VIPAVLLSKPALYAGAVVAVLTVGGLWYRGKINDAKREAVLEQQMAANDSLTVQNQVVRDSAAKVVEATRDTLLQVQLRADVQRRSTVAASANYDAQRRLVNTGTPQIAGVPAGHMVVPIAFVVAADSAIKMLPILLTQAALERAASQQRIDALVLQHMLDTTAIRLRDERIVQMGVALEAAKPSLLDRTKGYVIGGVVVYAAVKLLGGGN